MFVAVLRGLRQLAVEHHLPRLSMGMSGDYEIAIAEGATDIRIGSALLLRIALHSEHPMNLAERLMRRFSSVSVRANRNRRTLISLRRNPGDRQFRLSVHEDLLAQEDLEEALAEFIRRRGRGHFPLLRQRMAEVFTQIVAAESPQTLDEASQALLALSGHGGSVDLLQRFSYIHGKYWPQLPAPHIKWGRNPGYRRLRSIHFGTYRSQPTPSITIHPRLALEWVPLLFVDHVIHHELCHHAQHCIPHPGRRRETPHSPRFKTWERQFAGFDDAVAWEKLRLKDLLDPYSAG